MKKKSRFCFYIPFGSVSGGQLCSEPLQDRRKRFRSMVCMAASLLLNLEGGAMVKVKQWQ